MDSIQDWQNKADQDVRAAELCFEQALYDVCVSRCYYAMFHVAIAALSQHGVQPRRDQWGHDYVQSSGRAVDQTAQNTAGGASA